MNIYSLLYLNPFFRLKLRPPCPSIAFMKQLLIVLCLFAACSFAQNEPRINYSKLRDIMVEARDTRPAPHYMMQHDAFGRQRVSIPSSLFNGKFLRDKNPVYWDEYLSGTVSSTFITNDALVKMSVTNSGTVIRQTFQRFNYQAGKSQIVLLTGIIDPSSMSGDARARAGQFTASPSSVANPAGFWFEVDATNIYVCIGKPAGSQSGIRKIPRELWNEDKLDGNGPSKIYADFSKAQIFGFDYEWLGVGAVRFFIVQDNQFNVIHRFKHVNELDAVYVSNPNLPLRYDLHSTSGTGTMLQICSSIMTEPNENPIGLSYFAGNRSNTSFSAASYGFLTGFRLKSNYIDRSIFPKSITTMNTDNVANYQWLVSLAPKYTGTVTWVDDTLNLGLQIANPVADPGVTNLGYVLASGFVAADSSSEFDAVSVLKLGATITGQSQEMFLMIRAVSGTPELNGGMNLTLLE